MSLSSAPKLSSAQAPKTISGTRLLFIDNIRWLMIVLVILNHLADTYGHTGGWYYMAPVKNDALSSLIFALIGSFTQAFFMGLLFFIGGYFVPASFDKKGVARFLRDRLLRLGLPTLIFMVILHPLTVWMVYYLHHPGFASWCLKYFTTPDLLGGTGPLWFTLALLIFSIIYAGWRLLFKTEPSHINKKPIVITHAGVLAVIAVISLVAFLIRLVQPIGTAVLNMQLCFFSQYVILFILGIVAYRQNWLASLPLGFGRFWFRLALFLGIPLWFVITILGNASKSILPFFGGLHWQAAAYAVWESFFCIGICLGLLVIYREKYNTQGPVSRFLSKNYFGVYVFHAPIMVGITLIFSEWFVYPPVKAIIMAAIVLPVSFGFSFLIRRVPWLERIFS
jgi:glucans biosynthesis protein C